MHVNRDFGTIVSKLYREVPNVVPATGTNVTYNEDATIEQYPSDDRKGQMTTITKLPMDPIVNRKPALLGVPVVVAEEVITKDTTNEQYLYDIKSDTMTTSVKLPMEFLEVSRTSLTRGFLELAEEARHVCVRSEQCFMVDEDLSQVTGTTNPACDPSPWSLEEELRQYIRVKQECALRATRERDELRQMQWPDIKSDDMVMDGNMPEPEMLPVGSVRGAVEPVILATESEVFTPVVLPGGSLLRQLPWSWWRQSQREFLPHQWLEVIFQPVCWVIHWIRLAMVLVSRVSGRFRRGLCRFHMKSVKS